MKILEFGDPSKRKLILIHGFQCPYQVWTPYIEHYKRQFHILVPILPGHDPQQKEDFITVSDAAAAIEDYCISRYGKTVYAVFGMSMGGVVAAALWQNSSLEIQKVIFDGSPLVSVNLLIRKMMIRFYLHVTHKTQQRDQKTLEQAKSSIVPSACFPNFLQVLDNMSDVTIRNCIDSIAGFKLSGDVMDNAAEIYFYHGTAVNELLAKKSAQYLVRHYPQTVVTCFKGTGHCENSLFHPQRMIMELDRVLDCH